MAWMASHLFVETDEHEPVADAVEQLLGDRALLADLSDFEVPPGPITITPALEGWLAVTGAGAWLADLTRAAGALSGRGGWRVASAEVFGSCFRMRVALFEGGEPRLRCVTPEHGWDGDDEPAAMPRYDDAELLAYEQLRELRVPARLIAIGTAPFSEPRADPVELGQGLVLVPPSREGGAMERATRPVQLPPHEVEQPPVLPNSVGRDFGLMLMEDRYVEGRPDGAAVDRLVEVEEALLRRARAAAGEQQERLSLTVNYYAGTQQDRLDTLLRQRGRHVNFVTPRSRPPWWAIWRYIGKVR